MYTCMRKKANTTTENSLFVKLAATVQHHHLHDVTVTLLWFFILYEYTMKKQYCNTWSVIGARSNSQEQAIQDLAIQSVNQCTGHAGRKWNNVIIAIVVWYVIYSITYNGRFNLQWKNMKTKTGFTSAKHMHTIFGGHFPANLGKPVSPSVALTGRWGYHKVLQPVPTH